MAKNLKINCGTALMFKDERGILDSHECIWLNCGTLLVSPTINAKLLEKSAHINSDFIETLEITGEVSQLAPNTVIDGTVSYAGRFIIATGNLLVQGKGVESLDAAVGVFTEGILFYPASSAPSCLAKARGELRAYPDDAQVVIGDYGLEKLVANAAQDKKHIWVSGTITALDEAPLVKARRDGLRFTAQSLFTYEGFNDTYGDLFTVNERALAPDGCEVAESVKEGELGLYGAKLYVKGDLSLNEYDAEELAEKEIIIVEGRANLPRSCDKAFRRVGKAASYRIVDSRTRNITSFEEFPHAMLQALIQRGERISLNVLGTLRFADDVTPEDLQCIRSLSCNGAVIISNEARAALEPYIKESNGFIGEDTEYKKDAGKDKGDATHINTGLFVL